MAAIVVAILFGINNHFYPSYSMGLEPPLYQGNPVIMDSKLQIQEVARGLELPTTMAFIGNDDFLILEKEKGTVRRVINGSLLEEPVLRVNVSTEIDRGLLGIAALQDGHENRYVFLYYSEAQRANDDYLSQDNAAKGEVSNRLYRYEMLDGRLVKPRLLLDLPAVPNRHPGGQLLIGPDANVYLTIGDIDHYTTAQNIRNGTEADGTSAILRITTSGQPILTGTQGLLGDKYPLNLYYAYGVRNSFGLDFDPVTGLLWDTENGESVGDEINLVKPGFNSGWRKVQGVWTGDEEGVDINEIPIFDWTKNAEQLVDFNGKGKYSEPELSLYDNAGLTALKFLNSSVYGEEYEDDMFVGDFNNGNLYRFDLNEEQDRTELSLDGDLEDKLANNIEEIREKIFGRGFSGISDIEIGPDGYLYVISIGQGKVFRITNENQ
jgi:aldose sugar dehydrogenase